MQKGDYGRDRGKHESCVIGNPQGGLLVEDTYRRASRIDFPFRKPDRTRQTMLQQRGRRHIAALLPLPNPVPHRGDQPVLGQPVEETLVGARREELSEVLITFDRLSCEDAREQQARHDDDGEDEKRHDESASCRTNPKRAFDEAMRYRDSKSDDKILWIAASQPGRTVGEYGLPALGAATWLDKGSPWAYFGAEDVRTNVDVREYIRAKGL